MLNLTDWPIAINTGTNLPSVATPNGQAAFLFLLTSALAPLIRLSYGRMVIMALPHGRAHWGRPSGCYRESLIQGLADFLQSASPALWSSSWSFASCRSSSAGEARARSGAAYPLADA